MTRASDWTSAVGDVWAAEWRRTDRSFADMSRHLDAAIAAAAPAGAFRALDIGCGAGATTLALAAARADAAVVGVDLSSALVEIACDRAAPLASGRGGEAAIRFVAGDAVALARAHAPFDLLYSRHGVMFFDDPVAAFTALHAAARADARLIFSCFADWRENKFACALADAIGGSAPVPAAPGPFAFADPRHVAEILAAAGWRDADAAEVSFVYRAGAGPGDAAIADAVSFFRRIGPAAPVLRAAPPDLRDRLIERVTAVVADHRIGDTIDFPARAWIWSARA